MGKKAKTRRERESTKLDTERPSLRTAPNWPLFALAMVGVLLTSYLTWSHWIGSTVKGCAVGTSCDVVLYSKWGTLFGLPTSLWGLLAYATLAAIAFIRRADRHWQCAWFVALGGVFYSAYLTTISLGALHAACPYCLTSLALMTSVFVLVTLQRPGTLTNFGWGSWFSKTVPVPALVVLALHLHYSGFLGEPPAPEDPQARSLAIYLTQSGAKMYGAYWCPHCQEQKAYFGASATRLPYIECSPNGPRSPQAAECSAAGIQNYPTWVIGGKHIDEVMTLKQLADATGFHAPGF